MKLEIENGNYMIHSFNDTEHSQGNFRGLTKREYFAGLAMQSILNNSCDNNALENQSMPEIIAKYSIKMTDALLKELDK